MPVRGRACAPSWSGAAATSGAPSPSGLAETLRAAGCMCGIAGVLDRSGAPVPLEVLRRMGDVIAHRGPDDEGAVRRRARSGSPTGGSRSSTSRRPGTCRWRASAARSSSPTTARSTTSASCGRSSRRSGTGSARTPTPRSCSTAYERVGRGVRRALQRHVRASRSGTATARELFLARDRFGVKPLYYAEAGAARPVRLRRSSRCSRTTRVRAERQPPAPARVLHVPEHLHRRHAVQGRQAAARRPPRDDPRRAAGPLRPSATGTSTSASRTARSPTRGVRGGARPPVPAGRRAPAGRRRPGRRAPQRRHGLGLHHRARRAAAALPEHVHGRLRHDLARRHRAGRPTSARRPRRCPTCSGPSTTRRCSSRATWSAACRR